jgi:hypothetical protein
VRQIARPANQQASQSHAKPSRPAQVQRAPSREAEAVLRLQRTAGNRAVEAMLRSTGAAPPKPATGASGDGVEREDEEHAAEPGSGIMRKVKPERLEVQPADDAFELEADRVSKQVMRAPALTAQGDANVPAPVDGPPIARVALQTSSNGSHEENAASAPPIVGEVLGSPGKPLDADTRDFMQQRLGRDFGDVRLHTDARAAASADAVNATAFTVGHDIVFASGAYSPDTPSGRELIAHELTHVVQQGAARALPAPDAGATAEYSELAPAQAGPAISAEAGHAEGAAPGGDAVLAVARKASHADAAERHDPESAARDSDALGEQREERVDGEVAPEAATTDATAKESADASADSDLEPWKNDGKAGERAPSLAAVEEKAQLAGKEAAEAALQADPAADGGEKDGEARPEEAPAVSAADAKGQADGEATAAGAAPEAGAKQEEGAGGQGALGSAADGGEAPAVDVEGEADAMDQALAEAAGSPGAAGGSSVATQLPSPPSIEPTPARELSAAREPDPTASGPQPSTDVRSRTEAPLEPPLTTSEPKPPAPAALAEPTGSESTESPSATAEMEAAGSESANERDAEDTDGPAPAEEQRTEAIASSPTPSPSPAPSSTPRFDVGSIAPGGASPQAAVEEVGEHAAGNDLLPRERSVALQMLNEDGAGAPVASGNAGGGGGGAGAAEPEQKAAPPDVSSASPAEALDQIARLEPAQVGAALGGLTASVQRDVGERRSELAAAPPSMDRPIGAPYAKADAPPPGTGAIASGPDADAVAKTAKGKDVQTPAPKPVAELPAPRIPEAPEVPDTQAPMSDEDAARLQRRIDQMPTSVGGSDAGPAPSVALVGNANPQQMLAQHDELRASWTDARVKGARDAATPLGEHALYPDVVPERLTATIPGPASAGGASASAAGGAGAAAGGAELGTSEDAVAIIAREEKGAEVAAAVGTARAGVSSAEGQHTTSAQNAETQHTEALAREEQANKEAQAAERRHAQGDVADQRGEWTEAQTEEVRGADEEAAKKIDSSAGEVETRRAEGDTEARTKIDTGNREAEAARQEGERKAEAEKKKAEEGSGGFFGWIADKAKAAFNAIKEGIKAAINAARRAIKAALDFAKKLATEAIERARKWIVDKIKAAGDFLIALGDRVLSHFPALRDKFRNAIKALVSAAEAAINRLAEGLKKAVTALLDAYAAALDAALGLLQAGLLAAVDLVANAVQGAIKFAKAVVDALGTFAALVADIASGPGRWLSNLRAAVVDGIQNHLWTALKKAAQEWFNSKLESILGVGKTIWALVTGQLGLAEIGKMAWQAIIALLPPALIQILVEKLVAMIVPAAGAIMAIIEGLQAAWGTISRIIAAIDTFVAFLKAVKGGNAGPQFATAVASAAIVVLDFVANFLLVKLGKGLMKLGAKLKGIAKRLLKKRRAAGAPKRKKGKGDRRTDAEARKNKGHDNEKEQSAAEKKRKILDRAVRELPPVIKRVLDRGVRGVVLKGRLLAWRLQYRLSALELRDSGKTFQIRARVNPEAEIIAGVKMDIDDLLIFVRKVAEEAISNSPRVQREAAGIVNSEREKTLATKTPEGELRTGREVNVPVGTSHLGMAEGLRQTGPLETGKVRDIQALGLNDQNIATARQQQSGFARAPFQSSTQIIHEPSASGRGFEGGKYVEIAGRILPDTAPRLRGPVTAAAVEAFARTGEVAAGFSANQLHALRVTMFAAEHTRSPAAAVWGTMAMDLMKAGKTPEDILGSAANEGLHPLSPERVGTENRSLERRLRQVGAGKPVRMPGVAQRRQMDREVAMIEAWLKSLKGLNFDDNASAEEKKEEIRKAIKARIKQRMDEAIQEEPAIPEFRA